MPLTRPITIPIIVPRSLPFEFALIIICMKVSLGILRTLSTASCSVCNCSISSCSFSISFFGFLPQHSIHQQTKSFHEAHGITFLIDQIDVLGDKVDLASFLKATVEKFRLDSYFSVNFIVSGVTGTATKLIMQHPSSERIFEHVYIPRMSTEELMSIVDAALENTDITIEYEAKKRIAMLSNEFPEPAQLLGFNAFKFNTDNVIDKVDVEKAVRFIATNLRRQHFETKYYGISPGLQTEIIRTMANSTYDTVNISYLMMKLPPPITQPQLVGPLNHLSDNLEIIEKSEREQYRFRDPLFKIYLRMLFRMDR
jgi:hypothetical protein